MKLHQTLFVLLISFPIALSAAPGKGDKVERQKRRASAPPRLESGIKTPGGSRPHYQAIPETKSHYVPMPGPPASEITRKERRKAGDFTAEAAKAEKLRRRQAGNFSAEAAQARDMAHAEAASAANRRSVMLDAINTSVDRQYDRIPAELRRNNSERAAETRTNMGAETLRRSASFGGSSSATTDNRRASGPYQNFSEVAAAQERVQRGAGTSREHMGKVAPQRSGPVILITSPDGKSKVYSPDRGTTRDRPASTGEIKTISSRTGSGEIKTPGERGSQSNTGRTQPSGEIKQPGERSSVKERAAEIEKKAAAERKAAADKAAAEKAAAERKAAEKKAAEKKNPTRRK